MKRRRLWVFNLVAGVVFDLGWFARVEAAVSFFEAIANVNAAEFTIFADGCGTWPF